MKNHIFVFKLLCLTLQAVHYDKSKLSFYLVLVFFVIFGVIVLTDLFLEEDGPQSGQPGSNPTPLSQQSVKRF